jgi:pyruvate,water dikinase
MAGIIGGRGYINLSLQVSASRPFFGGDSRKALQQAAGWWGGVPEKVEVPLVPISSWAWWTKVLPSLTRLAIKMARLRKKIPQFVAENPGWCAMMSQRIQQTGNRADLAALWRAEIGPYCLYAFYLANAGAGAAELLNRLENELRELVGADDANALLSNLSGLSSPLESLGPLTGLAKVARGEMSREAYLQAYGHRGYRHTISQAAGWIFSRVGALLCAPSTQGQVDAAASGKSGPGCAPT